MGSPHEASMTWRPQAGGGSGPGKHASRRHDGPAAWDEQLLIERARHILRRLEEDAERARAAARLQWIRCLRRRLLQWEHDDMALERTASHLENARAGLVEAADGDPEASFAPGLRAEVDRLRYIAEDLRSTRRLLLEQRLAELLTELHQPDGAAG